MHIYAFGSICRGDISVDLMLIYWRWWRAVTPGSTRTSSQSIRTSGLVSYGLQEMLLHGI